MLVKGTCTNPDGALRASQFVRARIVWKTADGLVVPVTAVLRINGQYFAFVAERRGRQARRRSSARSRSGRSSATTTPVLDGIKPGERVVVSGAQKLADGAPIAAGSLQLQPGRQSFEPRHRCS